MAIEAAQRTATPTSSSTAAGDNQNAHHRVPTEDELASLFDEAVKRAPAGGGSDKTMTKEEQTKFLKAMGDPEFRSLLNDYMKEISDPANRAETEQYLAQLERDQKVPENKLLIKPTPGFVIKTKLRNFSTGTTTEKLFVNICSSEKLQPPSSTKVESGRQGTSWSLPYSVGPERMEVDKSGGQVATYDVCFHPRTLQFATTQKPYRDMVVNTSLDAVESLLHKSRGKESSLVVSREYHILKGVLYKSGEPVTMCLSAPAVENLPNAEAKPVERLATKTPSETKQIERLETKGSTKTQEKNVLREATATSEKKPLIEEVTRGATKTVQKAQQQLPKLEFRVIYRGKFEMLDHMQASLTNEPNARRPRELVIEIAFPNHASAKGIDLDVNDRTVKVETKGYAPLEVRLPFAVIEDKGRATFDKKARKLVVTLPVQPPEPVPVKRMAIVEQDDVEEAEEEATTEDDTTLNERAEPSRCKPVVDTVSVPKDDAFARLRETAVMVANDPMHLPRATEEASSTREQANGSSVDETIKACVGAEDSSVYSDLPPLESCSEDEDEIEMDLQDTLAMDPPQETVAAIDDRIVPKTPAFTLKETSACLSYLVDVAGVDASSVFLEYPTKQSFRARFAVKKEPFELRVDTLSAEIDTKRTEFLVATENLAIILYKASSPATENVQHRSPTPPVPPSVVRFQNDLLYDID